MKKCVQYFLQGLLILLPLWVTGAILTFFITWLDGWIRLPIPGLGFLIVILGITGIGYFTSGLFIKPFLDFFDQFLRKTPFINFIYTSTKDLTEAFLGEKKKFDCPVLIKMSMAGTYRLGFLTQDSMENLHLADHVAVYIPHSYNFSGNLYIIDKNLISKLPHKSSDIMKTILSGGMIPPPPSL